MRFGKFKRIYCIYQFFYGLGPPIIASPVVTVILSVLVLTLAGNYLLIKFAYLNSNNNNCAVCVHM